MATNPKDAKFIADQEERAARAAEKRAQAEQDAAKFESLKLKDQGISLKQYQQALNYRRQEAAQEKTISDQRKSATSEYKKTRNLARDNAKLLKSNTGSLLKELGIVSETNNLNKRSEIARKNALAFQGRGTGFMEKRYSAEQEAFNLAQDARKNAITDMTQGGEFDQITFGDDLESQLSSIDGLTKKAAKEILDSSRKWATNTGQVIESAGGGEDFVKKFEMSKDAMSQMDGFKDKIFKVKSFVTDPQFRGMLMKGFFLGLAVKAATALADVVKGTVGLVMELGVSFKSLPIAASLAKEETKAMLNEFGSLNDVTSAQLLTMKMRSKLFGVESADSAKILKLQTSISDVTKDTGLERQGKFIKEIRKQGLAASKVMADLASNADMFANFAKDGGKNMEDAAAQAAKMGLNLSATNSVAEKLLDFESSIAAEQEASMLLGKSINLDKARQLAFTGNLAQMMEEVKMQAGGEEEFSKMSVVQRQALGDAIGLQGAQLSALMADEESSTAEKEKGLGAILMGVAAGALLGAVLGAVAVGFGPALLGGLSLGLLTAKSLKSGVAGLGKGMAAGAGTAAVIGGGLGAVGGGLMSMQGRERGGPVSAGSPYVVGEKRPELFIPSQSGNILPSVPHMAEGTMQYGDMNHTNSKLDKLVSLMSTRNEQAEVQTKKLGRDMNNSFSQR
jgi:hypothetical protein